MSGWIAESLPDRDRQAEHGQAARSQFETRQAELWAALQDVMDPELDESVVELDFVTRADVDAGNHVHIEFRLPTYWCAANFSFLMADDMRRAVAALDWVSGVSVVLGEHMYADKINAGLAQGLSFRETFGVEADGDLDDLRRTFLVKAFQRRQVALLNHLTGTGHSPQTLTALTLSELRGLPVDDEGDRLRRRYLERRDVVAAAGGEMPAFVDAAGLPLSVERFAAYVSGLRRVGVNAEFNSALCRGLLSARFDLETPFVPKAHASA